MPAVSGRDQCTWAKATVMRRQATGCRLTLTKLRTFGIPGYSFEVESDFWEWEMARDGIATVQGMFNELKGLASAEGASHVLFLRLTRV